MDDQTKNADDATLLTKINEAVAAANEAERTVEIARAEFVSRSKAVGLLLLEAKKLHPAVKDFDAFLERVDGLKLSRAYDLMRLAGGRTPTNKSGKKPVTASREHRASKKLPKPAPALKKPEPEPKSIPLHRPCNGIRRGQCGEAQAGEAGRRGESRQFSPRLAEFTFACRHWLPKITVADQRRHGCSWRTDDEPKAEAA